MRVISLVLYSLYTVPRAVHQVASFLRSTSMKQIELLTIDLPRTGIRTSDHPYSHTTVALRGDVAEEDGKGDDEDASACFLLVATIDFGGGVAFSPGGVGLSPWRRDGGLEPRGSTSPFVAIFSVYAMGGGSCVELRVWVADGDANEDGGEVMDGVGSVIGCSVLWLLFLCAGPFVGEAWLWEIYYLQLALCRPFVVVGSFGHCFLTLSLWMVCALWMVCPAALGHLWLGLLLLLEMSLSLWREGVGAMWWLFPRLFSLLA
ncbi:hypothetical protein SUGI_0954160 [Cryptomeria japonica]|nr:hypothetical protein SUGI_0954160 [Cryptomeria japonica]